MRGVLNRIGWIVLPDGTRQVACCRRDSTARRAAPRPANLGSIVVGGVPVAVRSVGGGDEVIES